MKKYFLITLLLLFISCSVFSQDIKNKKNSSYHVPREMSQTRFKNYLSMGMYKLELEADTFWVVKSSTGVFNKNEKTPQYDTIYNTDKMLKKTTYPKKFQIVNETKK